MPVRVSNSEIAGDFSEIRSRPSKNFEKCSLFELRTRTGEQFGDRGRCACLLLNVAASRKVRDAGTPEVEQPQRRRAAQRPRDRRQAVGADVVPVQVELLLGKSRAAVACGHGVAWRGGWRLPAMVVTLGLKVRRRPRF